MAYKILKSMIELGYEPDVWTWTVILHGLCQQNAMSDAMHLVETMSAKSDAKPNVVTLNTLVRGWCQRGDMEMATNVFELASKMNVVPDEFSYNTLIRGWCEKGCEDRAIEVMERMKAAGVRPDVVTLTTLIRSYCKDRNMRAAMSLLETMKKTGMRPNVRTYNTLMQGWIELKNMDRAMDLFKQMKRNKRVRPTIVTYTLLIGGWARSMGRMDMAEKVMQDLMNDPDVSPNDRTFQCSHQRLQLPLHGRVENWRAERMYFWLCKMRDLRIKPNHHTVKPFSNWDFTSLVWTNLFGPTTLACHFDPRRDCSSASLIFFNDLIIF